MKKQKFNMSETAKMLEVSRTTIYNWIKKGLIKPRKDFRSYPVFLLNDIEDIKAMIVDAE